MKKKLLISFLCILTLNVFGQGTISHKSKQQRHSTQSSSSNAKHAGSSHKNSKSARPNPTLGTSKYIPRIKTFYVNGVPLEMIEVRGGSFMMGGTKEQGSDASDDEMPVHKVTLSSYYIGKYEVTQALWKAVMGKLPANCCTEGDDMPVSGVLWGDIRRFISKISSITGKEFQVPTEAQWEFAARGGCKSKGYKYSGSNNYDDVAWHKENSEDKVHPVGTKLPNELGIYDMSGNICEMIDSGWYNYSSRSQLDPPGIYESTWGVFRGGSMNKSFTSIRVSSRILVTYYDRYTDVGFRLMASHL